MLIRFVVKNLYSFDEQTEFNLLPGKTQRHPHHKIRNGEMTFVRYAALYGDNGAGKSNLVKSVSLLRNIITSGQIPEEVSGMIFKLKKENRLLPVSLGIEFVANSQAYFYSVSFEEGRVLYETLLKSTVKKDILLFERFFEGDKQEIKFSDEFYKTAKEQMFAELLAENLVAKDTVLISFLAKHHRELFPDSGAAYDWFNDVLVVVTPDEHFKDYAFHFDKTRELKEFANNFISALPLGIREIKLKERMPEEIFDSGDYKSVTKKLRTELEKKLGSTIEMHNPYSDESLSLLIENDKLVAKSIVTEHSNTYGENIEFALNEESDGTKRLINFLPLFMNVIKSEKVFIIDEIERSIHPLTVKEIISKITADSSVTGQLIFTTHETNLLDQSIFRPDEIWFAQKTVDGATKLYSLSDFAVHNTISIENGYLNGRFGAIPFLGDLRSLNW